MALIMLWHTIILKYVFMYIYPIAISVNMGKYMREKSVVYLISSFRRWRSTTKLPQIRSKSLSLIY